MIGTRAYLDLIEKRFTDALQASEKELGNTDSGHLQKLAVRAVVRVLAGQIEEAKSAGEEALPLLRGRLRERPDDIFAMTELSWVYLALGTAMVMLYALPDRRLDSMPLEKMRVPVPIFKTG